MSTCKSCGARIVWIQTHSGKWMPADEGIIPYKQSETGKNVVITDKGDVIHCDFEFEGLPTGLARIPHFATCPNADKHRKKGKQ